MIRLALPDSRAISSYAAALQEGYRPFINGVIDETAIAAIARDPTEHFMALNYQGGQTSFTDGIVFARVPFAHYWLVENETFIGAIDCRFALNERLLEIGGHVGYIVRPSLRRKGYAKRMLDLALPLFADRGLTRVLITCGDRNEPSIRLIESCGGIMENKVPNPFPEEGPLARRYWISL